MSGEHKTTLDEIVAGDEVAYRHGGLYHQTLRRIIVDKTTKTQIVLGSERFRKDDGVEISQERYKAKIFPLGAQEQTYGDSRGTYAQVVEIERIEALDHQEAVKLAKFIGDIPLSRLSRMDTSMLKQAAILLGYTEAQP